MAALGAIFVLDGLGVSAVLLRRWAGAVCIVAVAVVAGQNVLVEATGLPSPGGPALRIASQDPVAFGIAVERLEARVGPPGQPGHLGVRSYEPEGDDAGASLFAKGPDGSELRLDYRLLRRPRLISTSSRPFDIVTPQGVDLKLSPGAIRETEGRRRGEAVTRVNGRLVAEGRRSLTVDPELGVLVVPEGGTVGVGAAGTVRRAAARLVVGTGRKARP